MLYKLTSKGVSKDSTNYVKLRQGIVNSDIFVIPMRY
nr:MAG TPA: hypothetical protein [Caudoviricetes sp.]